MLRILPTLLLSSSLLLLSCSRKEKSTCYNPYLRGPAKLEYQHPGLVVDLDVGFKADPMPMDFDGDGDLDLLVSESGAYTEAGVYYFENITGPVTMPLFRYHGRISSERFRLGYDGMCFEVSFVHGHTHVLTPDRVNQQLLIYRDVPQNVFWDRREMPLPATGWVKGTKYNSWKMLDFDHDGRLDLLCGLSTRGGRSTLLFFRNTANDTLPHYAPPQILLSHEQLPDEMKDLKMETALADFDGDGDIDFVAVDHFARFVYFENRGTPSQARFAGPHYLTNDSLPLQMVSHYGGATKITALDWDGDGHPDLLAGDEDGKVSLLLLRGTDENGLPRFDPPRFFRQEALYVDLGALTAPRVYDWDHDGRDDLLCGNGLGSIVFLRNLGGYPPRWDAPVLLQAGGHTINLRPPSANWGYTTLDVGLWDEDDLPDLLVNNHDGKVVWFRNKGSQAHPVLEAAQPVKVDWHGQPQRPPWVPGHGAPDDLIAPWRTSPLIYDFNDDGFNDLVMLDAHGYLAVYLRKKKADGTLILTPPRRSFVDTAGHPILLNQRTGSSSGRLKIDLDDWDGDGLDDLIVSSKPAVDWFKGQGIRHGMMTLVYMGRIISRTLMGHTDGPVTCDWNHDHIPDLLVGTETGAFWYWQRENIKVTTTMTTTGPQRPAAYPYFKR